MKNYTFLIKPVFFILSLVFSCWMVMKIEQIQPSDFGRYRSLFEKPGTPQKESKVIKSDKKNLSDAKTKLKKLCQDYKAGLISSNKLDEELEKVIK